MTIGIIILLIAVTFIFGPRILVGILVSGLIGWLLCNIDVSREYFWYSGIWHGLFFVPNSIRHLVWDTPFKAEMYSAAYNVFYWIFSVLSTLSFIFGGGSRDNRY